VAVQVRRIIVPPNRASLAQRPFDVVHGFVRSGLPFSIAGLLGRANRATGRHQPADKTGPLRFTQAGIRHPPQSAADDEIAAVRRYRVFTIR
jgi:hypothetical protein